MCRYSQGAKVVFAVIHQVGSPGGLTKAGVVRWSYSFGEVWHFLGSGRRRHRVRSVCSGKRRGGGGVSRTCVSHFEGSLRNGLHLFSDL